MRSRGVIVDTSFVSTQYFVLLILVKLYYHCLISFLTIYLFDCFFNHPLAVNVLYEEVIDFMHIQLFTRIIYVYGVSLPRFDHELLDS